jgi:Uma2 family endonuclease
MQQPINRLPFDPPRYSYEDYKNWNDEWELIDGYPYFLMPSPKRKHQHFISQFTWVVKNILFGKECECDVYSEFDWIVNNETVVRPDLMIVCGAFDTDWLTFPPTLIVEIASASTYMKDRNIKYKLYEMNKVKYYLLADTEKEKIDCYELIDGIYQLKQNTTFLLDNECEINIDFEQMWR